MTSLIVTSSSSQSLSSIYISDYSLVTPWLASTMFCKALKAFYDAIMKPVMLTVHLKTQTRRLVIFLTHYSRKSVVIQMLWDFHSLEGESYQRHFAISTRVGEHSCLAVTKPSLWLFQSARFHFPHTKNRGKK